MQMTNTVLPDGSMKDTAEKKSMTDELKEVKLLPLVVILVATLTLAVRAAAFGATTKTDKKNTYNTFELIIVYLGSATS